MEREYSVDSNVDKFNLDAEYEHHPSTYMYWAEKAVDAHIERLKIEEEKKLVITETKKELEEVRAEVDADVRKNWADYGLDPDKKPTETAIAGAVVQSKRYKEKDQECVDRGKEAVEKWIKAVRSEKIMDEARQAMAFKRSSIEGLERLVLRNYYPRFSKDVAEPLRAESKDKITDAFQKSMEEKVSLRRRKKG